MRGAIEARRRQTAELLLRMQKVQPVLKARVDAATGDERKKLAEQQVLLGKKMADAERTITQAESDLKAIENPGSRREELTAVLARQRSAGKVGEDTEISASGLDPYKKGKINRDVTATTTAYADGKATTEKVRDQRKLGADGYTETRSHDKAVTDGRTTARSGEEKKTKVSLGGKVSTEEKKSVEVALRDGRKAGIEHSRSKEISSKGASQSETVKKTNFDGSSSSHTAKREIERGDGKVTAGASDSVTTTGKSGTARTTDKSATGSFVSGKDGTGVQGGVDGGRSVTSKKGLQAGVVGGLHASVLCKVGEPKGEPKIYPVTLTVTFGASAGVSGGAGKKEGSKVSASVEVKGSVERSMTVTHHFAQAELEGYKNALASASKGAVVSSEHKEFAIIALGAVGQWDAAREMWKSGGVSKKTTDTLRPGDTVKVSETKSGGASGKVKAGPVGAGYGVTDTHSQSLEVTRTDQGALEAEKGHEHGRETNASGTLDAGAVSLTVGKTKVHKTRFGFSFAIDPKNDPDGKILEHLHRCKSSDDYAVFFMAHAGKVTLIGSMQGQTDAEGTQIGVGIAGQELKIGTQRSLQTDVRRNARGKAVSKTSEAESGAGGQISKFADSKTERGVAQSDELGTTLTVSSTETKNYGKKAGERKDRNDDDATQKDTKGIQFSHSDLEQIGASACRSLPSWNGTCVIPRDKDDWIKAGIAIKKGKGAASVVGHELNKFLAGGIERMRTIERVMGNRPKRFEFPDSLRDLRGDYDLVTDDKLDVKMNIFANKNGDPAAAQECERLLAIADRIEPRLQACKDYDRPDTKAAMLSDLNNSRQMLNRGIHGFKGNLKPEDDPKILAVEGERLRKLCVNYFGEQLALKNKMDQQDAITISEKIAGRKMVSQLENMHERWWIEYRALKTTFEKRKLPFVDMPLVQPQVDLVATYGKKFGR